MAPIVNATTLVNTKKGAIWPALVADGVGLGLLLLIFEPLAAEFSRRSLRGGLLMLVIFVLFAFGVNALKRLAPQEGEAAGVLGILDFSRSRPARILLALPVVLFFVVAQIDVNQATESMMQLMTRPESFGHEGEITLYYSFGPIFLWLMAGVVYLVAFILPTEKRVDAGTNRYAAIEFLGLVGINAMLLTAGAYLATVLARFGPAGTGLQITAILGILALLELLFDPPRLLHAFKNPGWWPLVTYAGLVLATLAAVWRWL